MQSELSLLNQSRSLENNMISESLKPVPSPLAIVGPTPTRWCNGCETHKTHAEFYDETQGYCIVCNRAANSLKNPRHNAISKLLQGLCDGHDPYSLPKDVRLEKRNAAATSRIAESGVVIKTRSTASANCCADSTAAQPGIRAASHWAELIRRL